MSWSFLKRDNVLPVLSDEELVHEVGVDPDNLTHLKEYLHRRKPIPHFSTFLQGRSALGQTTPEQYNDDDHLDGGRDDDIDSGEEGD